MLIAAVCSFLASFIFFFSRSFSFKNFSSLLSDDRSDGTMFKAEVVQDQFGRLRKGDIVTFTYESFAGSTPVSPVVSHIRSDFPSSREHSVISSNSSRMSPLPTSSIIFLLFHPISVQKNKKNTAYNINLIIPHPFFFLQVPWRK